MSSNINATNYKFCRFTSWEPNIIHLFSSLSYYQEFYEQWREYQL